MTSPIAMTWKAVGLPGAAIGRTRAHEGVGTSLPKTQSPRTHPAPGDTCRVVLRRQETLDGALRWRRRPQPSQG